MTIRVWVALDCGWNCRRETTVACADGATAPAIAQLVSAAINSLIDSGWEILEEGPAAGRVRLETEA